MELRIFLVINVKINVHLIDKLFAMYEQIQFLKKSWSNVVLRFYGARFSDISMPLIEVIEVKLSST